MARRECPCGCGRKLNRLDAKVADEWTALRVKIELLEKFNELCQAQPDLTTDDRAVAAKWVAKAREADSALGTTIHGESLGGPGNYRALRERLEKVDQTLRDAMPVVFARDEAWATAFMGRLEATPSSGRARR